MMPDYARAADKAAETIIKYGIRKTPVSPLPILEQMNGVLVVSFADVSDSSGLSYHEIVQDLFGRSRDAIASIHPERGKQEYVIAYNSLLPFAAIQRALAREMGHILLGHKENTRESAAEAACFAHHLLCPRPLIHAIQATGIRITVDMLAMLTGTRDQDLTSMRRLPATSIPAGKNRFIRNTMLPFVINFIEYYQTVSMHDGSALADIGSYMEGYEE